MSLNLLNRESTDVYIQFAPQTEGLITTTIEFQCNDPALAYLPFEHIILKGKKVPDTDGDGEMDYNDNPNLNDPDSDNDGLSDDLGPVWGHTGAFVTLFLTKIRRDY